MFIDPGFRIPGSELRGLRVQGFVLMCGVQDFALDRHQGDFHCLVDS